MRDTLLLYAFLVRLSYEIKKWEWEEYHLESAEHVLDLIYYLLDNYPELLRRLMSDIRGDMDTPFLEYHDGLDIDPQKNWKLVATVLRHLLESEKVPPLVVRSVVLNLAINAAHKDYLTFRDDKKNYDGNAWKLEDMSVLPNIDMNKVPKYDDGLTFLHMNAIFEKTWEYEHIGSAMNVLNDLFQTVLLQGLVNIDKNLLPLENDYAHLDEIRWLWRYDLVESPEGDNLYHMLALFSRVMESTLTLMKANEEGLPQR